jgi:serine/threonine protein kinase
MDRKKPVSPTVLLGAKPPAPPAQSINIDRTSSNCGGFGCFYIADVNKVWFEKFIAANFKIFPVTFDSRTNKIINESSNQFSQMTDDQLKYFKSRIEGLKIFLFNNKEKEYKRELEIIDILKTIFGDNLSLYTTYIADSKLLKFEFGLSSEDWFIFREISSSNTYKILRKSKYIYAMMFSVCSPIKLDDIHSLPPTIIYKKFKGDMTKILTILHGQKYAHCDIKYENLVLCNDNFKLIDLSSISNTNTIVQSGFTYRNPQFYIFDKCDSKQTGLFNANSFYFNLYNEIFKPIKKPALFSLSIDIRPNSYDLNNLQIIKTFLIQQNIDLTPIQYIKLKDDEYCLCLIIIDFFFIRFINDELYIDKALNNFILADDLINGLISELPYFYLLSKKSLSPTTPIEIIVDRPKGAGPTTSPVAPPALSTEIGSITLLTIFDKFKKLIK